MTLARVSTLKAWRGERVPQNGGDLVAVPANIEQLWSDVEMALHDLARAEPFVPPSGKQSTGSQRFVRAGARIIEDFDVENIPPPPTKEQKIARMMTDYGITLEDLRSALQPAGGGR